jgi:ribonuclease G
MTRERIRPSILHKLSETCPCCGGIGRLLSRHTVAAKIERWFKRAKVAMGSREYRLTVHPDVAQVLEDTKTTRLRKLGKELRLNIELVKDDDLPTYGFRVYDLGQQLEVTDMFRSKK